METLRSGEGEEKMLNDLLLKLVLRSQIIVG